MLIVQLLTVTVFYVRHWNTVTRHMAQNLVADLSAIISQIEDVNNPVNSNLISLSQMLNLNISWVEEKKIPEFYPGDVVKVGVRITEGKKERIQYFEGVCIAKKSRDLNSSFTVRKISFGEGVERTFPLYGTLIDSIKVIRSGKVRRAKLYYLRDRTGKSARIAEKIRKKIGIDVDVKPETVTEENVAPPKEAPKEEAPKIEAAPAAEAPKEEAPKTEEATTEQSTESTSEKK